MRRSSPPRPKRAKQRVGTFTSLDLRHWPYRKTSLNRLAKQAGLSKCGCRQYVWGCRCGRTPTDLSEWLHREAEKLREYVSERMGDYGTF